MEVRVGAAALALVLVSMGVPVSGAGGSGLYLHCRPVAPGMQACPQSAVGGNRTCVAATTTLCVVHDVDAGVAFDEDAGCVEHDPGIRAEVGGLEVTVCAEADPTPSPPPAGIEPPDDPPDGRTRVAPCSDGVGATAIVRGTGARVCVEVEAGSGGDLVGVNLEPCPGGTDPRFDVAGHHVTICVRAQAYSSLDDPDAGDAEVPRPDQVVRIRSADCRQGQGVDAFVSGADAVACVAIETPQPGFGECEGTGVVAASGDDEAGACAE